MPSDLQWAGILLLITCSISPTWAQQLPPVACPEYFEYLSFNGEFIGHIALRHDPLYEKNDLRVEFSQYGAYDWVGFPMSHHEALMMFPALFPKSYHTLTRSDVDVCLLSRSLNELSINCIANCSCRAQIEAGNKGVGQRIFINSLPRSSSFCCDSKPV